MSPRITKTASSGLNTLPASDSRAIHREIWVVWPELLFTVNNKPDECRFHQHRSPLSGGESIHRDVWDAGYMCLFSFAFGKKEELVQK